MDQILEKILPLLSFRYYIYWIEFLVIVAIIILVLYLGYALNLFKRE